MISYQEFTFCNEKNALIRTLIFNLRKWFLCKVSAGWNGNFREISILTIYWNGPNMKFKVLKICSFPFLNVCITIQFEVKSYRYGLLKKSCSNIYAFGWGSKWRKCSQQTVFKLLKYVNNSFQPILSSLLIQKKCTADANRRWTFTFE